jgi:phospholipase/lecithinase/hemolysin
MFNSKFKPFKLVGRALCAGLFLFGAMSQTQAAVYSLGDSLSDAGALGFTYTNPTNSEPLAEGNVWVQYIAKSTPAFCNDVKHCKFDRETFYYSSMGNNYAVGGAGVTFDSTDALTSRNFTSLHFQIEALKHNHKLKKDDVITVWIGANDILAAAFEPTFEPAASLAYVSRAGEIFKEELTGLSNTGAKLFVITIPKLGMTPLGAATNGVDFLNQLTDIFNQKISKLANLKNVTIIDSNVYFSDVLTSREFDTSNTYCSAIIDPVHQCGNIDTNPITGETSGVPFVFADPIHPSNAVHRYIGEKLKSLLLH